MILISKLVFSVIYEWTPFLCEVFTFVIGVIYH